MACVDEECAEKVCCKPKKTTSSENGSTGSLRSRCATPTRQSPMNSPQHSPQHSPRHSIQHSPRSLPNLDKNSYKGSDSQIADGSRFANDFFSVHVESSSPQGNYIGDDEVEKELNTTSPSNNVGIVNEQKINIVIHSPTPPPPLPQPQSPQSSSSPGNNNSEV